ncbi:MAG: hypothetical protein ACREGH_02195 [Minisyncoccia bacterium]
MSPHDVVIQNLQDLAFIKWGKKHGVLVKIKCEGEKRRGQNLTGTQSTCCPDSDQFRDISDQHHRIHSHPSGRYGWLNLYGGAALIPAHSPLARRGEGKVLLHQFYLGHIMRKGEPVLYIHAPCGKVRVGHLSVRDTYQLLLDARDEAVRFFEHQAKMIRRYIDTVGLFRAEHQRGPSPGELMLYGKIPYDELCFFEEVSQIRPLAEACELATPNFSTVYQVDYGKLGEEQDRRRTYRFDCEAYAAALNDNEARAELYQIA